jgi:hypothetical protein
MARSAKTVSIRHLHAAVKTALEAAKKKHPAVRIESLDDSGGVVTLPIYFRYPWICGLPPAPWPEAELGNLAEFNQTFVNGLASDRQIAALGVDGKFEPAIQFAGGKVAVGFVPGDALITE